MRLHSSIFCYSLGRSVFYKRSVGMSKTSGFASFAAGNYNAIGTMSIPLPFTTHVLVYPETKEFTL